VTVPPPAVTESRPEPLTEPPPELRFRRPLAPIRSLREFWHARELLWALTEREFQARYAQTLLGIGWALVTPILLMLVFMLFVNRVVNIDTHGAPYSLFVYLGLLPWTFFSSSVSRGGQILVFESSVLNKVRCPREVFPASAITVAGYDFALSVFVLGVLFIITGYEPRTTAIWVPLFLVMQIAFCTGVALGLSVIVVFVRDIAQAIPLLLQLGLFATPVAYDINAIPTHWQPVYAALNPLVGVIEGYRDTILYGLQPPWRLVIPSAISAFVYLVGGYLIFKKLEAGIADVA
jgi:ABC-2 type transport system permease protein/lipopolysaccharide transport system permease protein